MMKNKIALTLIGSVCLVAVFGVAIRLQAQRQAVPPPATGFEYLVLPVTEIGIDPTDVLLWIDHEETTERLNQYAAEGWRVTSFEILGRSAVVLEREIPR